jgi:amino acid adenylation domain-containing protein
MTLEAFENQELPFELLVKAIEPKRNESHNPLFQIMFVLQNAPRAGHLGIAQLADEHPDMWPPTISYGTSKFDLSMSAAQSTEGLIFSLEYSTDLFEDAAITRMLDHYRNILKHVTAEPDVALSNIRMLSEDEYNKIVYAWNDVEAAFRDDVCIHQRVEETVDRVPDTVALVFQGEEHTYGELDRRANRLAHRLVEAGVQPGYRVALLLERSLEIPVAMLAVLKAGGVYVPIEPELPDRRIELLLKDVEPAVVVTRAVLADRLPTGPWRVLDVSHLAPLANGEAPPDTRIPNQIGVDSLAYIIYTSGSTGQPKGVMVNHRSVLARLDWMVGEYKVSPDDCFIQRHPYSFDVSVWEYFLPLFCGSRLLLLPPGGHKDLALMRREMEKYQVTIACFLPSMLSMFLDEPGIEHLRPHLRLMLCGAETMQSDLPHRYYTHFGGRLDNLYGPTEACIHCTYWRCVNATLTSGPIPIGKPQSNTRIYILDEMMRVQPPGLPGEIYIGGPGVARGYWKRPDISERVFLPNHLVEGDRLYKTGDLAMYLPSGDVEFIGRLDGQVKVRGYRVEPGEVHHVLVSHPCVREAAVIPRDDLAEGLRLAAYVVPQAEQAPPTRAELRTFLEERLPGYMVPSAFVFLERLPLTQNGKLDHQALPAPKIQIESEATAYTEPRTDTERSIADIWCSLLGLEFVGIHDDFFQLGGDSLLATCVVARIRSRLGIELPLRKVFDSSRLEQMAKIVDGTPPSERQTETCPITRVRKQDGGSCA